MRPVPLPSPLPVGRFARDSVVAAGTALGFGTIVEPDPVQVAAAYRSDRHLRIDGATPDVWSPLSRFWRTADGWVRTHGNYAHHAAALFAGLDLPDGAEVGELADRLESMTSDAAASTVRAAGGICVAVRAEDPTVDAALRQHPLVEITRLGDSAPVPLAQATATAPLAGIRVLDLTRVIAGPVATRTLAFAGADVLRIDPPNLPEPAWQHLDTGHGKRSALLDIVREPAHFARLLADADVVVLGYRPEGLARLGLSPERLAAEHPHLVIAQLSAWPGDASPRGFDSIVQADSGISLLCGVDGEPGALPAQALDHSAGYLLAGGIVTALRRRAEIGGAWQVRTSLRRMAAELLGMPRGTTTSTAPITDADADAPRTQTFEVDGHRLTTVAPAVVWPGAPKLYPSPRPWGRDAAEW